MSKIVCPHCNKVVNELDPLEQKRKDYDRFFKRVKRQENGCWLFTGGSGVYGRLAFGGKPTLAHRVSWIIHKGPIPEDKHVLHDCPSGDTPRCVNPSHLWTGTDGDNVRDAVSKGRFIPPRGETQGLAKLNNEVVLRIRQSVSDGTKTIKQWGEELGTTFQAIWNVARGRTWTHIGGPLIGKKPVRNLSVDEVIEIRRLWREGSKGMDIAHKFGIHQAVVSNIVNGKKRKDVPM